MTGKSLHFVCFLILVTACGKQSHEDHVHSVGHDSTKITEAIKMIASPVNQVVLSSQKTLKPSQGLTQKTITATGYIAFDERRNNKVAVSTSGRIEKLYIKFNFQYIKKGERIAELYSPELSTYQDEYLFLLKSGESRLADQARQKLKLLGLSEKQIQQIEKSGVVTQTITLFSPENGFVRFSETARGGELKASSSPEMSGMSEAASPSAEADFKSAGNVREGMYVSKGQTLLIVNDCSQVWAILSFDITSLSELRKGLPVTLYSEVQPQPIIAKIDLVEPIYGGNQRFTQARIYLDNQRETLKVNSFVKGEISFQDQTLTVPLSSIYDLGSQKIVWVKTGTTSNGIGLFEPQVVVTGITSNNSIEIVSGLQGNESIALDAGYMLDSESILNGKQ